MTVSALSRRYPSKRAFITGAGSGLGRALALQLAAGGWTIGINDLNAGPLEESRALIAGAGGRAISFVFDVADKTAYRQAFADYLAQCGGIDLLVNNAGVGDGGLFDEYPLENWDWITGINQMGVIYGCWLALAPMKQQGYGHIINIASAAGYANLPNMSMYSATKAAVISVSETLYAELKPSGIEVSVVMPTFFRTHIMQHGRGPQQALASGEAMVNHARIMPGEVAAFILKQAGRQRFHIFYPFTARLVWLIKRWWPGFFLWLKVQGFKRRDKVMNRMTGGRISGKTG